LRKMKPAKKRALRDLSADEKEVLGDWLLSGLPYQEVRRHLKEEFQVVTTLPELLRYWNVEHKAAVAARRARAAAAAQAAVEAAARNPAPFEAAALEQLQQYLFELASQSRVNPRTIKLILAALLDVRRQQVAERKLELELQKYRDALTAARNQLQQASSGCKELTPELARELVARVDEILGLHPGETPGGEKETGGRGG